MGHGVWRFIWARAMTMIIDNHGKENASDEEEYNLVCEGHQMKRNVKVSSDNSNVKVKGELEDPFQPNAECEDPRCHVWEHVGCVIIPEKPMDGNPPLPDSFYCEICSYPS
ncbi:unnamed protein product [Arabis nemorensis]|uniref:Zinc finger PHD-type domain-containing protein n=1 Tax=Arabis nemorensis TaxID=586526 RepID=A0A565ATL6_9BRAS|nr:unnamed protein product [Arabis nemorensis]